MRNSNLTARLSLVNCINDNQPKDFVIFQINQLNPYDTSPVAWQVVEQLAPSNIFYFDYTFNLEVATSDTYNNFTPNQAAALAQLFQKISTPAGQMLLQKGTAKTCMEIDVLNALPQGSLNAHLFRSNLIAYTQTQLAPGQTARFQPIDQIYLAALSGVNQGTRMNVPGLLDMSQCISLQGVSKGRIKVTGGGPGGDAEPYQYTLQIEQSFTSPPLSPPCCSPLRSGMALSKVW